MRYITGSRQVQVGGGHVDAGAQHVGAVGELARAHAPQQVEALGGRPVAVRALPPGAGRHAAVFADLFRRQAVDVGITLLHQLLGQLVQPFVVVGGVVLVLAPVEAEPADVLLDRLHVLQLLALGVGVVEAQAAETAEFAGDVEVEG